eukprot:scaffold9191_cov114-Isochrysis_galbana.AAC.1
MLYLHVYQRLRGGAKSTAPAHVACTEYRPSAVRYVDVVPAPAPAPAPAVVCLRCVRVRALCAPAAACTMHVYNIKRGLNKERGWGRKGKGEGECLDGKGQSVIRRVAARYREVCGECEPQLHPHAAACGPRHGRGHYRAGLRPRNKQRWLKPRTARTRGAVQRARAQHPAHSIAQAPRALACCARLTSSESAHLFCCPASPDT